MVSETIREAMASEALEVLSAPPQSLFLLLQVVPALALVVQVLEATAMAMADLVLETAMTVMAWGAQD